MLVSWLKSFEHRYGLDLRSLALLRLGLALGILGDLWVRLGNISAYYSDQGSLPRSALGDLWLPGYWSVHALSGTVWWQVVLFAIAALSALLMLIGYRTRWATMISWILLVSLHNRNPQVVYAADDVLRAILFWSMFLPLGSSYAIDQALNTSPQPQPKRILTGATLGLMVQQCYIYELPKLKGLVANWAGSTAIIDYAIDFELHANPLGRIVLNFAPLFFVASSVLLLLFWLGPLMLWSPIKTDLCRMIAISGFILLHVGIGLTLNLDGTFPILSCFTWLAFLPTSFWDRLAQRVFTPKQLGLKIYYDADCGFCKKVVHLLRTFLVLPRRVPLQTAQSDPVIQQAMETHNSWVIVDWQGKHRYKWYGIAYVVSLSPIAWPLANILRWSPLMALGNRLYETIANNRRFAGNFTKPFKYQSFKVQSLRYFSLWPLLILLIISIWNLRDMTLPYGVVDNRPPLVTRLHRLSDPILPLRPVLQATRLDQSWSIYPPVPPQTED